MFVSEDKQNRLECKSMSKLAVSSNDKWYITVFSLKEPYLLKLIEIGLLKLALHVLP